MKQKSNFFKINRMFCILLIFSKSIGCFAQGLNSTWLLGHHYSSTSSEGRMTFTSNNYSILSEQRVIPFLDCQGNISDANGNLLMSSNGYFIADATGDTMFNGSGINPGQFTEDYKTHGLPLPYGNIILPMPDDSNKYVLFHLTLNYSSPILAATEIYYSIIDITLNGGLGAVISKNNIALTGSFGWSLAACKHGNGRDWWVVALSDSGTVANKFLLSPNNVQFINSQNLSLPGWSIWGGQPTFSSDGSQFAFSHTKSLGNFKYPIDIRLFDFDRCNGNFSLKMFSYVGDSSAGFGISFSSDSKKLYVASLQKIYQYDTDSINIAATKTVVAVNDTFASPSPPFYTNFYLLYLAYNGKIYTTSTNGVLDLHEMDYPDSIGTMCNVNLHNVHLPCFNVRTVPNHPNYYLGRLVGSPCDTIPTSINELQEHNFRFRIYPNPVTSNNLSIGYLLPQNTKGIFQIFDINGKVVFKYVLPPWSNEQHFVLPQLKDGLYNCVILSGAERVSKKIAVIK